MSEHSYNIFKRWMLFTFQNDLKIRGLKYYVCRVNASRAVLIPHDRPNTKLFVSVKLVHDVPLLPEFQALADKIK